MPARIPSPSWRREGIQMVRTFEQVGNAYEVTLRRRPGATPLRLNLHSARRLLAVPMRDPARMRRLRELLGLQSHAGQASHMTDAEVVERLATQITAHRLYVYAEPIRRATIAVAEQPQTEEALGPAPLPAAEEPVDDTLDVPAQVAVMREAAREGKPFCEECEKARLDAASAASGKAPLPALAESAPTPAADPYADTDVAAQAATMRSAAQDGTPFCEECEKARLASEATGGG